MTVTPMASLLTQVGEVLTAVIGWIGDILAMVAAEPLLLVGLIFAFIFTTISIYKSVRS